MNNVFSAKRFGKYFLYDLGNAKNNFGLSLLILGFLPVIIFAVTQLMLLLSGNTEVTDPDAMTATRIITAITVVAAMAIACPVKLYGAVTDKRAGSSFLMLPASIFEKWLSSMLIVLVVVPVLASLLYLGSDALLALIFPNRFGESILSMDIARIMEEEMGNYSVSFNGWGWLYAVWCPYALAFFLGALLFKKGKVGKTILAICALGMVTSFLMWGGVSILGHFSENIHVWFETDDLIQGEKVIKTVIGTVKLFLALQVAALMGLIYWRFRAIKH